jgi:hypothetical protein
VRTMSLSSWLNSASVICPRTRESRVIIVAVILITINRPLFWHFASPCARAAGVARAGAVPGTHNPRVRMLHRWRFGIAAHVLAN